MNQNIKNTKNLKNSDNSSNQKSQGPYSLALNSNPTRVQALFKTTLCTAFLQNNSCRFGLSCQFAHGPHELRELHKARNYKTRLCKNYALSGGVCPFGDKCTYLHDPNELQIKENNGQKDDFQNNIYLPKNFVPEKFRSEPCLLFFRYGFCQYGKMCTFSHDDKKIIKENNNPFLNNYSNFLKCAIGNKELFGEMKADEEMMFEKYDRNKYGEDLYVEDPDVLYFK